MTRRGFTIVELIITITIMGILLTLAVVNLTSTQMQARDSERKTDVETIATSLESFYSSGNSNGADISEGLGRYPTIGIVSPAAAIKVSLPDADLKAFMAPGIDTPALTFIPSTNTGTAKSIQTTAGVLPQPTKDQYVYQPIETDGSVCVTGDIECRKFNIFYRLESDNTVYKITSKNQ